MRRKILLSQKLKNPCFIFLSTSKVKTKVNEKIVKVITPKQKNAICVFLWVPPRGFFIEKLSN